MGLGVGVGDALGVGLAVGDALGVGLGVDVGEGAALHAARMAAIDRATSVAAGRDRIIGADDSRC